jgi:hypothetical protein
MPERKYSPMADQGLNLVMRGMCAEHRHFPRLLVDVEKSATNEEGLCNVVTLVRNVLPKPVEPLICLVARAKQVENRASSTNKMGLNLGDKES